MLLTADAATRLAFSRQRIAERASTVAAPGPVLVAHADEHASIRVVLPSPYGK
jgi:hypothetical protein